VAALAQVVIEKTHVGFDNVELEKANQGDEEQLFKPPRATWLFNHQSQSWGILQDQHQKHHLGRS
jgi:hypothetical protein